MNREFASEIGYIINAFAVGKDIQVNINGIWCDCGNDLDLNPDYKYRIKETSNNCTEVNNEKIYSKEELLGKAIKHFNLWKVIEQETKK